MSTILAVREERKGGHGHFGHWPPRPVMSRSLVRLKWCGYWRCQHCNHMCCVPCQACIYEWKGERGVLVAWSTRPVQRNGGLVLGLGTSRCTFSLMSTESRRLPLSCCLGGEASWWPCSVSPGRLRQTHREGLWSLDICFGWSQGLSLCPPVVHTKLSQRLSWSSFHLV